MAKRKEKILEYNVIFSPAEEGGFTVTVPSLPGCISEGDSFEEAKANIQEAIELYLEDSEDESEDLSNVRKQFMTPVSVRIYA